MIDSLMVCCHSRILVEKHHINYLENQTKLNRHVS